MIFDGIKFRRSTTAVKLPAEHWTGNEPGERNYVTFGRLCSKVTPGAIKCISWYSEDYDPVRQPLSPFGDEPEETHRGLAFPVYAKPVDCDGHSLTNLMYGKDGYMYLAHKGEVYVASWKKKKC